MSVRWMVPHIISTVIRIAKHETRTVRATVGMGGNLCDIDKAFYCGTSGNSYLTNGGTPPTSCYVPNPLSSLVQDSPDATVYPYRAQTSVSSSPAVGSTTYHLMFQRPTGNPDPYQEVVDNRYNPSPSPIATVIGTLLAATPLVYQLPLALLPHTLNFCGMQNTTYCSSAPSVDACSWDTPTTTDVDTVGCYFCSFPGFGRDCTSTCEPSCVSGAICTNSGPGQEWPQFPGSLQLSCVCPSNYTDALPSTVNVIEGCVTCQNELNQDTPTCSGHGSCGISTWTGPPAALRCACDSAYIDLSCTLLRTTTVTCGAQGISFNCTYQGPGSLGVSDYRYICQAHAQLATGTSPDQSYAVTLYCPNVPSTLTCSEIHDQCLLPSSTEGVMDSLDICPLPFKTFPFIGQAVDAFCDPPRPIQYVKASVYGHYVFCYLRTQVDVDSMLGLYRCVPPTDVPWTVLGTCDVVWQYSSVATGDTEALGALLLQQCV